MKAFISCLVIVGLATEGTARATNAHAQHLINLMLKAEKNGLRPPVISQSSAGRQICYDDVGCFSRFPPGVFPEPPWFIRPKLKLYIPTAEDEVMVYNYNSEVGKESNETQESLRDRSRKLVFVVHGFGESGSGKWVQDVKNAKKRIYGENVIVVDWVHGARATTLYLGACANSVLVARVAARLCLQLVQEYKIPLSNVEVVGFSLGGQVSGFFAKEIFKKTGKKIGRITALDCAAPQFESRGIYPSTAHTNYLEAVHTSAGHGLIQGKVGTTIDYGHVDYYINGGIYQPACSSLDVACAHLRAHDYYLEAITNMDKCLFRGFRCATVGDANTGSCQSSLDPTHFIGQTNFTTDHTILLVPTNSHSPFCVPQSEESD